MRDCEKFNVPLDTDVILETSLSRQSIALALTTKTRKQNTAYILYSVNNKRETEKTALANKTNYAVVWYASYELRSGNTAGPIATAPQPHRADIKFSVASPGGGIA